jgi:hypothetical protein
MLRHESRRLLAIGSVASSGQGSVACVIVEGLVAEVFAAPPGTICCTLQTEQQSD